ncbi:MAG: hypothetical protein ACRDYY_05875 [Acidimicrobiales bacterium]
MTEEHSPIEVALDLLVYAPVGLALTAVEELPKLAAKGRAQIDGQRGVARIVGQFALSQGRRELSRRLGQSAPARSGPAKSSPPTKPQAPAAPAPRGEPAATRAGGDRPVGNRPPAGRQVPRTRTASSMPAVARGASDGTEAGPEGLAIPGYDSLSASQVVQRLAGLSGDELVAVGAYESAHRARRTILTRVGQLQER